MLNAVIIEDERPALENLVTNLSLLADDIKITARLSSVRESVEYLSQKPSVDLIFSDVQLSDGGRHIPNSGIKTILRIKSLIIKAAVTV